MHLFLKNFIPTITFQSRDQVNRKAMNVTCLNLIYKLDGTWAMPIVRAVRSTSLNPHPHCRAREKSDSLSVDAWIRTREHSDLFAIAAAVTGA